jgi:hydroxymethylbilane synthase
VRIRVGTRGSPLALWQADHVASRLRELGHEVERRIITTTGDRILDRRLENVGGKGAFLKEIEDALLGGELELAVHSLKDVPVVLPPGLRLCAILERADPRDALVSGSGRGLGELPEGARIGTTSLRRRAQLRAARADLVLADLRGNVDTRLRKARSGEYDAVVLALAGLTRLGRAAEASEVLEPEVMLPAPGQGAVALECREQDAATAAAVRSLDHAPTARAVVAERAFLAALGGGCNVPLGAHAEARGDALRLQGLVAREADGQVLRGERSGGDPEALGRALAADLMARGAARLLAR